ncbi:MAG TPA: hypothetical protein VFQ38_07800 [Longimicrobiales bacterium]|nr:hypothetical protein [Longimicrobiales bacterium]
MLRPMSGVLAGALACALAPAPGHAQEKRCVVLCTPAFISQTGIIITNAIRPQEGVPTKTFFNLRFTTVIPTRLERLALVAIFQMQPAAPNNSPAIVYGGVITLLRAADTGGWVDASFNPLGVYSPRAVVEPGQRPDNNKLDLEGEVNVHVFNSLPKHVWLRNVAVYGLLDYLATGLPGEADPWVILIGLNVPIAPLNP